jgi:hypothetical protein
MIDSLQRIKRAVTLHAHDQNASEIFREDRLALKNSVLHPYRGSCQEGEYGRSANPAAEHRLLLMPRADPAPATVSNRLTHPIGVRALCCLAN